MKKYLITALLLCFTLSLSAAKDIFEEYGNFLKQLQSNCKKIDKLIDKKNQVDTRLKAERRSLRDSSQDDDDDNDNKRDEYRRRRQQAQKEKKKIQDQLAEANESLLYDIMLHERIARDFQLFLDTSNIQTDERFDDRSKIISKNFKSYGIGFDQDKTLALRHSAVMDPAYIFALISYDLACLEAAGVTTKEIPANYRNFSTFFRFYEHLEFYRIESGGFGAATPTPSKKFEMKRRIKLLFQAGQQLNRLLLRNNPELAQKLDLPGFLEMLKKHHRQYLFRELSDFDVQVSKMLDSPSNMQKKIELMKRDLAFRAAKFDGPAKELRAAKISGNTSSLFEVKKERRKRRSKKDEKISKVISRETMFFADNMAAPAEAQETIAPVTMKEKNTGNTQTETPDGTQTTESRTRPNAADLQKYRREVEAFRREYAGTHALITEGISSEYFPILKQTMTPGMRDYFESQKNRLVQKGKAPAAAAAEAYLKTLSAEKENEDRISVEEMKKIRRFMKDQKE